jgi:putative membrane protein
MASDDSIEVHINRAVKHYASLFTLPSHRKICLSLLFLTVLGGTFSFLFLSNAHMHVGFVFGLSLFFVILLSDYVVAESFLKNDSIFNFRRCAALSFYACLLWFGLIFLGNFVSLVVGDSGLWIKFFILGFYAVLIIRLLVFASVSTMNYARVFLSAVLQPILCSTLLFFLYPLDRNGLVFFFQFFVPLSIILAVLSIAVFVSLLNQTGKKSLGIPSLELFKAFLQNWIANSNEPLEKFFEAMGKEQDVQVSLLFFRAKAKNRLKAVMVVPSIHPGPFKNVGSSVLPYMIQAMLENKLGCVVSVPHGLFGHELDLASQTQNNKVIENIVNSLIISDFAEEVSPFVQQRKDEATASCQIFGNCALFTLTVAPETTEDLPQELEFILQEEAKKHGLSNCIVVNAHNSIKDDVFNMGRLLLPLKEAAISSLKKAALSLLTSLEVGAAKIIPKEFSLKEGMGLGGITAIVMKVGAQKVAYVTIDGNNMVSGLREKMLHALRDAGIEEGEILTTDTHAVSAIVLTKRGYHPIGEVMDEEKIIGYVKQAVLDALNNLEPVEVAWRRVTVPNVKVIGVKQIESLSSLLEKAMQRAKHLAATIFLSSGLFLLLMLYLH